MRSNSKHSVEELERYIKMYLEQGISHRELRGRYGLLLSGTVFRSKVSQYQEHLEKGTPTTELARRYNIPAHETVRQWIIKYTKGKGIKIYSPKPEVYTMKSRNVTHDEKVKIVKDCLANGLSYKETAEKYRVPYNNVYSWVRKYKEHGSTGLIDGRGRGKPDKIQTDEEKL